MKSEFDAAMYNEDYFENGIRKRISNYERFRWIPERSDADATHFLKVARVARRSTILDFGCAKGFLVRALVEKGHDAYGWDISPYAIENADPMVRNRCHLITKDNMVAGRQEYDIVIVSHVLEHFKSSRIIDILTQLYRLAPELIISIPVGSDGNYWNPKHNADVSHKITEPPQWWAGRILSVGARIENMVVTRWFQGRPDVITFKSLRIDEQTPDAQPIGGPNRVTLRSTRQLTSNG